MAPPDPSPPRDVSRIVRAALTERLGYKAAAIFFAVVLWFIASAEEPSEDVVPVRIDLVHDSMRTLTSPRPIVRALVVGRARELIKLFDDPLVIRRVVAADASDSVRLELRPADIFLPPGVEAIVREVQPRSVLLAFDVRESRVVPVKSTVQVVVDSSSIRLGHARLEPDSVVVTGSREAVRKIGEVRTLSTTVVLKDTASYMIPLDMSGHPGIRVRPTTVKLSLSAMIP